MGREHFVIASIPAFNEEKSIAKMILETQKHVDRVVVCDDGSTDLTAEIAERLGAEVVKHDRNLGYGTAVQTLFRRAKEMQADVMVTIDGDGQHDPRDIPALIEPVLAGEADVVIGSRFLGDAEKTNDVPTLRRWGIRIITGFANRSFDSSLSDAQSGLRAYGRNALESVIYTRTGWVSA